MAQSIVDAAVFALLLVFTRLAAAQGECAGLPFVDLSCETSDLETVDREEDQYLGHPSTVLLEDGRTILCVYPEGHGKGAIRLRKSTDGGRSWSKNLRVPKNWSTSLETPTIHRVVDAAGRKRLILWSGLYPARLAVSEDDGAKWSPLEKAGDWGGIVVMGFVEPLKGAPGRYLAMFHDDGRYATAAANVAKPPLFKVMKTFSSDGGLTWTSPETVFASSDIQLCEPGAIRSPDGSELLVLLRENARKKNAHMIVSRDEGVTWSAPRELPPALTGDRHVAKRLADGRLFVSFRDMARGSTTRGDWVAWVGTYDDIVAGRPGQYRIRLADNLKGTDCGYPGVEVLPDQTIVAVSYGHWTLGEAPYVISRRLRMNDIDKMARDLGLQSGAADLAALQRRLADLDHPMTWVITGDSITHGARHTNGARSYPEHFAERVRYEMGRHRDVVVNTGISGNVAANILEDFAWRVGHHAPDVVSLMIGMNDCQKGDGDLPNFKARLVELVRRIRAAGAIPILHTQNPIDPTTEPGRAALPQYMAAVVAVATSENVVLVDHWEQWRKACRDAATLKERLNDAIHPNARGHRELAILFFRRLGIYTEESPTCRP